MTRMGARSVKWVVGVLAVAFAPVAARAEGGTVAGKVEAIPARFLGETVVYL